MKMTIVLMMSLMCATGFAGTLKKKDLKGADLAVMLTFVDKSNLDCDVSNDFDLKTPSNPITFALSAESRSVQIVLDAQDRVETYQDDQTGDGFIYSERGLMIVISSWTKVTHLSIGGTQCALKN